MIAAPFGLSLCGLPGGAFPQSEFFSSLAREFLFFKEAALKTGTRSNIRRGTADIALACQGRRWLFLLLAA